jgi:hypothetical protein
MMHSLDREKFEVVVLTPSSLSDPWTEYATENAEFVRLPNGVLDAHHMITGALVLPASFFLVDVCL